MDTIEIHKINSAPSSYLQIRKNDQKFYYRKNLPNGKSEILRSKSYSLDAIIEELYLTETDHKNSGREEHKRHGIPFHLANNKPLIPRVKLAKSVSNLRDTKSSKPLFRMSTDQEKLHFGDLEISSRSLKLNNKKEEENTDETQYQSTVLLQNNNDYDEIPKKQDENYFTTNFDHCMKRLQLIEKDHEMIEKEDSNIHLYFLSEESNKQETENKVSQQEELPTVNFKAKNLNDNTNQEQKTELEREKNESLRVLENSTVSTNVESEQENFTAKEDTNDSENQQEISKWYSTLKHQFEKPVQENEELTKMSCRITGATLKNSSETQKSENTETNTRHYFSRLVKSNKSLIDEELPDPDKVKNIRAMFQENLNSTLKRKLNKKLGGSLQNISFRSNEVQMSRPLSVQCNRDDGVEIHGNHITEESKKEKSSEILDFKDTEKEISIEATKRKLLEKYERDLKMGKELRNRKLLQPKWTDTGSVSSGVSSDLSSYDTDMESYLREGPEQEPDVDQDVTISDDDLLEDVKDKHYVQNEILEKIRSFGTSVTYYGGEMITCSVGPLLSPTAQAIMEEIGEKYGSESSPTRSFDEFYRKYVETNEPNRKKKLSRARSFGHNDVFQKPNVLSNTEIEMYKNDLEIEIGIKKPTGMTQNGLKMKVTKSNSLGCTTNLETPEKKSFQAPIITIERVSDDSDELQESFLEPRILEEENKSEENFHDKKSNSESEECHEAKNLTNDTEDPINNEAKAENGTESEDIQTEYKKVSFERSKSTPEESAQINTSSTNFELPSKEILFGYEKCLLNGKRKSDMEFEEFEVCESVSEKLDKLQEVNASGFQNSIESSEPKTNLHEKEINEPVEEDTFKTEVSSRRKWNINLNEANEAKNLQQETNSTTVHTSQEETKEDPKSNSNQPNWIPEITEKSQYDRKQSKYNQSRWPIETTVVVDIQKNNEHMPQVITNGKTVAKTKIRLF